MELVNNAPKAIIYSDGSYIDGYGGWAAVVTVGETTMCVSGASSSTTNNRMELMAAIMGLSMLRKTAYDVSIYSDSQYLVYAFSKGWIDSWREYGWKRSDKKLANKDMWMLLYSITQKHHTQWNWVKGHSTDKFNNLADELARQRAMDLYEGVGDCSIRATTIDGQHFPVLQEHLNRVSSQVESMLTAPISYAPEDFNNPVFAAYTQPTEQQLGDEDVLFDLPQTEMDLSETSDEEPADVQVEDESSEVDAATAEESDEAEAESTAEQEEPDNTSGSVEEPVKVAAPVFDVPCKVVPSILGASDMFLLQLLMEMEALKECEILRPCGNYLWCEGCHDSSGMSACAEAFVSYRAMNIP